MKTISRLSIGLAVCLGTQLVAGASAQSVPVPVPKFASHDYSTMTYFVNDYPEMVRVTSTFEHVASGGEVTLAFKFKTAGLPSSSATHVYTTSFKPTFFERRSGLGDDVFYVGGWSDRQAASVIEKWTFESVAVSASAPAGGSPAVATIAVAPPRREVIAVMPGRVVIHAACNPYGPTDTLYLLEEVPGGRVIVEMDGSSGVHADLLVSGSTSDWRNHNGIYGGYTDVGHFVVYTDKHSEWDSFQHMSDDYEVVVIKDTNLDGQPDDIGVEFYDDLITAYDGKWVRFDAVP